MFPIFLFLSIFSLLCWITHVPSDASTNSNCEQTPTISTDTQTSENYVEQTLQLQVLPDLPELPTQQIVSNEPIIAIEDDPYSLMTKVELLAEIERRQFKGTYYRRSKKALLVQLLIADDTLKGASANV